MPQQLPHAPSLLTWPRLPEPATRRSVIESYSHAPAALKGVRRAERRVGRCCQRGLPVNHAQRTREIE